MNMVYLTTTIDWDEPELNILIGNNVTPPTSWISTRSKDAAFAQVGRNAFVKDS